MKIVGNKDYNEVAEAFVALGWTVDQRRTHVVLRHPTDGANQRITLSTGTRALANGKLTDLRKKLKRAQAGLPIDSYAAACRQERRAP